MHSIPPTSQPPSYQPLLALRMKSSRIIPTSTAVDDVSDRLRVMRKMETSETYKNRDYLLRRKLERQSATAAASAESTYEVDTLCREKMVDWCYRVIDHFNASRELVGIAVQYLDRFVDSCTCDRTSFKLAAMTSLYLATKVFHARELSMHSLAELSRGEFDVGHIAEMEQIILQTLKWRVHPPTTQDALHLLQNLLPLQRTSPLHKALYQRAIFFSELSAYDYCFVTQPRTAIAIACLLNAMEGMEELVNDKEQQAFFKAASEAVGITYSHHLMESIRNRLWYVYSQSSQYQADEILPPSPTGPTIDTRYESDENFKGAAGDQSPISIVSSSVHTRAAA